MLPSLLELEELLSKHAMARARKSVTTIGLVARIVHQWPLLGARAGNDFQTTLARVNAVVARAKKVERKRRESASAPLS
jgi:hypothetical protein